MNTAITYLAYKFFYRIKEFLRHWYVRSARKYWHFVINQVEKLDYHLAWKITLNNLFTPLYKDYSVIGYILGFIFRSFRLLIASVTYATIFTVAIAAYLFWLAIPAVIIYGIITGRPISSP